MEQDIIESNYSKGSNINGKSTKSGKYQLV